jgi:hypothetical protein
MRRGIARTAAVAAVVAGSCGPLVGTDELAAAQQPPRSPESAQPAPADGPGPPSGLLRHWCAERGIRAARTPTCPSVGGYGVVDSGNSLNSGNLIIQGSAINSGNFTIVNGTTDSANAFQSRNISSGGQSVSAGPLHGAPTRR